MLIAIFSTVLSSVVVVGALLIGLFTLWRRLEHEHLDEIDRLIDKSILALIGGFVAGKLAAYLVNWPITLRSPIDIIFVQSGFNLPIAFGVGMLVLYTLTKRDWRDTYHIVDLVSISATLLAGLISLSVVVRTGISMIGTGFQGSLLKGLIFSIVSVVAFTTISVLLSHFELVYRTFVWYRYRRSSAQSGFVVAMAAIFIGVWQVVEALVLTNPTSPAGLGALVSGLLCILAGFVLLYIRSGRAKGKAR